MISELVGGAFLSAFLQVLFDRLASRQFIDFFRRRQFDHSLLHRLQTTLLTVNGVLKYLTERKDVLGLVKESIGGKPSPRLPTTSLIDESEIYGRDADKEEILKSLLSGCANGNQIPGDDAF
ncbi:hypothetical protein ACOSP7_018842 [Xanthoceras sorbifolium]